MNLLSSSVLFILLTTLSVCSSLHGGRQSLSEFDSHFYCGRKLARLLANICDDRDDKRSLGTMYNAVLTPYYKDIDPPFGWPWMLPHKARTINSQARGKRFIVSECCDKSCNIEELLSYC